MFTGLIEDVGTVESIDGDGEGAHLRVATGLAAQLKAGESVAVNGVCLTATQVDKEAFAAEAMNQTLRLTSLGRLIAGDRVNLELALQVGGRLGGHFVQGHVDGTGEVVAVEQDGIARRLRVRVGPDIAAGVIERGSVAIEGVSLTVAALGDDWLEVSLIPETLQRTNLDDATPGRALNVECDLVGRYVKRLLAPLESEQGSDADG